jgi:aspartate aminotransferase
MKTLPPLARRLEVISVSPTMRVMMEAKALRAQGVDVVDFGPGEPDFNTPDNVKQAGRKAIADDLSHYTEAAGLLPLRRVIAARYRSLYGASWDDAQVITGVGGKNVLFLACLSLFDPGDRVALYAPYWVSFPEQVRLCGALPVVLPCEETDRGPMARAQALEPHRGRLKAIILNSPCNPSGAVLPAEEIAAFAAFAAAEGAYLISDETYDAFYYGAGRYASCAAHLEALQDRLIVVNSMSKTYAMTGWRIGYALAPKPVAEAMKKVQSHDATHTAAVSQAAAIEALEGPQESVAAMRDEYRRRRDELVPALNRLNGVRCAMPEGAFYVFPDVRGAMERLGCATSIDLAARLMKEAAVAVVPGEAFGVPGRLRLSYALAPERMREGVARLRRLLGDRPA